MADENPSPVADETAATGIDGPDETAALADSAGAPTESERPRVLLTGAIKFTGLHILNQLLKTNKYSVRAVVQQPNEDLLKLWPAANHPLEIVVTNIWTNPSWSTLLDGCTYMIHAGSPTRYATLTESKRTALFAEGTMNLLKAAKEIGTVQRVVFVSSIGAIIGSMHNSTSKKYTEEDWSDVTGTSSHLKELTNVEMEAWKYVRSFREGECFQLTVVNPAMVMGPLLSKFVSPSRLQLHRGLMEGKMNRVPNIFFPIIDVRDLALAVSNALTARGAENHRHLLSAANLCYTETAKILSDEFSKYGYDVPTKKASYAYLWFSGLFDKKNRKMLKAINKQFQLDTTRMRTVLNVTPRDTHKTLIDMGYSMIDRGLVKRPVNYTGRHSV